ncbi:MAG: BBP7 family outer membrane beta-barrel protein [Pirellulales bacterium]|nr:BBP7 family outer membrane beta-barrel protein [Pirellulales bacterium]
MLPNRIRSRLAAGVLMLLIAAPACAQDLEWIQPFASADISSFGSGIQPKEGYFFVVDALHWSISKPNVTTIGKPNYVREAYRSDATAEATPFLQANTMDTGSLTSAFASGNRFEFGRVFGHRGWLFSGYFMHHQDQRITASSASILFEDHAISTGVNALDGFVENLDPTDPTGATTITELRPLPILFDDVAAKNLVDTWSVELMCLHRFHQLHRGGVIELFAGARYMQFDDSFGVTALGDEVVDDGTQPQPGEPAVTVTPPAILADSVWDTLAENHIIGPQVGLRYCYQQSRWSLSTEGRFFAGFNSQNIHQRGTLGSRLAPPGAVDQPYLLSPIDIDHSEYINEWSPLAELRVEAKYQLTRAVTFRVGWTGFWMDGIARASNMISYEIAQPNTRPNPVDFESMGILAGQNRQAVFGHGLAIGLEVNR